MWLQTICAKNSALKRAVFSIDYDITNILLTLIFHTGSYYRQESFSSKYQTQVACIKG